MHQGASSVRHNSVINEPYSTSLWRQCRLSNDMNASPIHGQHSQQQLQTADMLTSMVQICCVSLRVICAYAASMIAPITAAAAAEHRLQPSFRNDQAIVVGSNTRNVNMLIRMVAKDLFYKHSISCNIILMPSRFTKESPVNDIHGSIYTTNSNSPPFQYTGRVVFHTYFIKCCYMA